MGSDERAIREVHATWIDAVNGGDLVRLLALMANDVVFLNPGQAPFGRDGFPNTVQGLTVCNAARRRRSNGAGRTSDHHIPQTVRRPLASGPRCQDAVPASKLRGLKVSASSRQLLAQGCSTAHLAHRLHRSAKTVDRHFC
jgi:hypothetical protein